MGKTYQTMITATSSELQRSPSRFFARSALVMLALTLSAFPLSYFSPVVTGAKHFPPIYHIHGIVFFGWIGLYAWQTHLVATARTARHRELGLAGIAISTLLIPLGLLLTIAAIQRRIRRGDSHPFDYALYNVFDIACFAMLMIASIAAVTRHVDWHRRFAYGAALCLVGPAISRWFSGPWFVTPPYTPPLSDLAPYFAADLFYIALILYDRRKLGRIHPATLWMCLTVIPLQVLTPFAAESEWWRALAPVLIKLG